MAPQGWSAGLKQLSSDAQKLAGDLKIVSGQLGLEPKHFQSWRKHVQTLLPAQQSRFVTELLLFAVRMRATKKPTTTLAVTQMMMLTADLIQRARAEGRELKVGKSRNPREF